MRVGAMQPTKRRPCEGRRCAECRLTAHLLVCPAVHVCSDNQKLKGSQLHATSRLDIKLDGNVVVSIGGPRRLTMSAADPHMDTRSTFDASNGTRALTTTGHIVPADAATADRHHGRELARTREDRVIFSGCISVVFGIRLCFALGMWWSHGADVSSGAGGVHASIGVSAGVVAEASVNAYLAEVGIYAEGTMLDANVALAGTLDKGRVCVDLGANIGGVRWEQGLYYRVLKCGCKWCCRCRCKMGGRKFIGSPSAVSTGGAKYTLWDSCR